MVAGCGVRLSCYCCYSRILMAFTQSHSSCYCSRPKLFSLVGLSGRRFLWRSRTLWIPLAVVAIIVGVAYWRLLPDIAKVNKEWGTDTPPTSMAYIPQVFTAFMGVGYAALLSALLLLAGFWSAIREKRGLLLLCAAIIVAPILMSLQGVSVDTSAFARYLICSLPLLLILIAEGIDWLARQCLDDEGPPLQPGASRRSLLCAGRPWYKRSFSPRNNGRMPGWPSFCIHKCKKTMLSSRDGVIGFTLSQFFERPEDRIMLPDKYVRQSRQRTSMPR